MKLTLFLTACLFFSAQASHSWATADLEAKGQEARDPEAATGVNEKSLVSTKKFMVSAANPYAVEAGYKVLKAGGSAIDAAIAVQMVLTLVEPQSSGIGGGAFILHWNKDNKTITSWDGRETAPASAKGDLFLDKNGQLMDWWDALAGGRSVGTPGVIAALFKAHEAQGKLPWASLFEDAIALSEKGFIVSERLHQLIAKNTNPSLGRYAEANAYFFPNGAAIKAGALHKNPELASTLRLIAKQGPHAFYEGDIAEDIINTVQNAKSSPGLLTKADLKAYKAIERAPVCSPYHQYKVCGMAPPTSGGITLIQILSLLEPFKLNRYEAMGVDAIHLLSQASRLAYADRGLYIADNDFVDVPVTGLLDKDYLKQRSSLIKLDADMGKAKAGSMPKLLSLSEGNTLAQPSTSHISIVDSEGNAVSMTTSIEMAFGSTLMVRGFLLNNQLTDFSFADNINGKPVANRVEGKKRPRSSMAPTMIFNQNQQLIMVIGSPGGSRIINYVAKTVIGVLDWGLNIQQAIDLPNSANRNGNTDLELGTDITALKAGLEGKGYTVNIRELNSGLHGIVITSEGLEGGADSRREGIVMGE